MKDKIVKAGKRRQRKSPLRAPTIKPTPEEVLIKRRSRGQRPFPAAAFEEAMSLAVDLMRIGSGQKVRRLTLFDDIKKAPESGASRMLITNANRYGLVAGSYTSEYIELTSDGAKAVDDSTPPRERTRIRAKLAIQDIEQFNRLYERFKGTKLPARAVLVDAIKDQGVTNDFAEEGVDTFIVNLRFVGLLQTLSGAERIITVEHLTDMMPASRPGAIESSSAETTVKESREPASNQVITQEHADFQRTCFYITPIGEVTSEQRAHSDLFLGNIVEPALEPFGLKVVRADAIDKPGMITRQVIEFIMRARLVIADLSFHNPNVFYELALRHATRLPVVQIVRIGDSVPFDVGQMRTIRIDTSSIYALVPKIETYRSEIGSQVRRALESDADADTPISTYFPSFRAVIG